MNKDFLCDNKIVVCILGILILVCILTTIVDVPDNKTYNLKLSGDGTKEAPFMLDREGFKSVGKALAAGEGFEGIWFSVENDCNLTGLDFPLGGDEASFGGIIDGKGHQLTINANSSKSDIALLGKLSGTVINLVISEESVIRSSDELGRHISAGIAVYVEPDGKIINCQNLGNILGERKAGIAGYNDGLIINCATLANPDGDGAKKIVRNQGRGILENCYTAKGGCFELWNLASDEVNTFVTELGCEALNERLVQLKEDYPDYDFCSWENGQYWPRPLLSNAYSTYETIGETVVALHITKPGEYHLKGEIKGQVLIDLPDDNNDNVKLYLDGVNIINDNGPAILCKTPYEIDKDMTPFFQIILADNTNNYVNGGPMFDIFSEDHKNEGAISSDDAILFSGNGKLVVTGALEGIEAQNRIVIESGYYEVNSLDDGLASDVSIDIMGGECHILAGDDVIDSNGQVSIENAIVIGETPMEQVVNTHGDFNITNSKLIGFSSMGCRESMDGSLTVYKAGLDEVEIKSGDVVVITDENDTAIAALKAVVNSKYVCAAMPELENGNCKFYLADKVEGEFNNNICFDVKNYEIVKPLKE